MNNGKHPYLQKYSGRDLGIKPSDISRDALQVLERLQREGYESYIVGGSIRDILTGKRPKDFDISTEAKPRQIRKIFSKSRLIGRRFQIVHVYSGKNIIEVATFRRSIQKDDKYGNRQYADAHGHLVRDNIYGTVNDDARRRDFTINAIYYDPSVNQLLCNHKSLDDLHNKIIRLIGNPYERYREDPVRMIRALRFSAKLGFTIEETARAGISDLVVLLANISESRLYDEVLKVFRNGKSVNGYSLLREYGIFKILMPLTENSLNDKKRGAMYDLFLCEMFRSTDYRINNRQSVTPAFIFAGLWWLPVKKMVEDLKKEGIRKNVAVLAVREVIAQQNNHISIPVHFRIITQDILRVLSQFNMHNKKSIKNILKHPRFRAAYDMFCLLSEAGFVDREECRWWTDIQTLDDEMQASMIDMKIKIKSN